MAGNSVWFVATVAVAVVAGVLLDETPVTKKALLRGLQTEAAYSDGLTVALGYNACLDLVVDGVALMEALPADKGQAPEDANAAPEARDHAGIASIAKLKEAFMFHFKDGIAAERVVVTKDLFTVILDTAHTLDGNQQRVGGNAALMALQFARLAKAHRADVADADADADVAASRPRTGAVLLGGTVGGDLGRMLGSGVRIAGSPAYDGDEVHLIMEYAAGATWHGVTAPRANRFIITHDRSNGMLTALESFHKTVTDDRAPELQLLVLSGMHMVERALPDVPDYRSKRLGDVRVAVDALRTRHPKVLVHAELASVADDAHMAEVFQQVVTASDSMGFNEQEAVHLYNVIKSGELQLDGELPALTAAQLAGDANGGPCARSVALFLRYLIAATPSVSRVHFHALQFHVVAQRAGDDKWLPAPGSVAAGSVAATLRACDAQDEADLHGNDLDVLASLSVDVTAPGAASDAPKSHVRITESAPVATFTWGDVTVAVAPVLVCRQPRQTVGLGDAVSSTGLAGAVPVRV